MPSFSKIGIHAKEFFGSDDIASSYQFYSIEQARIGHALATGARLMP